MGSSFQELRDDISKTYTNDEVQDIKDYNWIKYDDEELTLTSTEETILEYILHKKIVDIKEVSLFTFCSRILNFPL